MKKLNHIFLILIIFVSGCGEIRIHRVPEVHDHKEPLTISVIKLPEDCAPEIMANYPELKIEWTSLNGILGTKLDAAKFKTKLEKIKNNILGARNSYDVAKAPKLPTPLDINNIDPNNLDRLLKQYDKEMDMYNNLLTQHKNRMDNIEKECVNKLLEEKKMLSKKVENHFGIK